MITRGVGAVSFRTGGADSFLLPAAASADAGLAAGTPLSTAAVDAGTAALATVADGVRSRSSFSVRFGRNAPCCKVMVDDLSVLRRVVTSTLPNDFLSSRAERRAPSSSDLVDENFKACHQRLCHQNADTRNVLNCLIPLRSGVTSNNPVFH